MLLFARRLAPEPQGIEKRGVDAAFLVALIAVNWPESLRVSPFSLDVPEKGQTVDLAGSLVPVAGKDEKGPSSKLLSPVTGLPPLIKRPEEIPLAAVGRAVIVEKREKTVTIVMSTPPVGRKRPQKTVFSVSLDSRPVNIKRGQVGLPLLSGFASPLYGNDQ